MANEEMQAAFVKSFSEQVNEASGKVKRRKSLARTSEAQRLRTAYLEGIRDERMRVSPRCEDCGVEGWDARLELHHTVKRSQGTRYSEGKPGVDNPSLLRLLCRTCHNRYESQPWEAS